MAYHSGGTLYLHQASEVFPLNKIIRGLTGAENILILVRKVMLLTASNEK
jgi:hypothetical protein